MRAVVSCPAVKRLAAIERDVVDVGQGAVGERGRRDAAHHVGASRRARAAFLDVLRELPVEELQRLVLHRLAAADAHRVRGQLFSQQRVVGLRHAEQVGNDEQRERLGELADELARSVGEDLVDLAVGQPPHEVLVLLQPLGSDQAHEQPAVRGVQRRIERRQLVAERQLVAVRVDDVR